MAALADRCPADLVDLSRLRAGDLDDLLAEEQLTWRSTLTWDFSASAELVKRYLAIRGLTGCALVDNGRVLGYCYYVVEDRKGIIGDLFVRRDRASAFNEDRILTSVLHTLISTPGVERIEAQLMMMHGPFERALPMARFGAFFPRQLMIADLQDIAGRLPFLLGTATPVIEPWSSAQEDAAARIIAAAYRKHIDSSINDQYRTLAGARNFLYNAVNYPGGGSFYPPASFVAFGPSHQPAGVVLASIVAPQTGHVTQVCVAPEWKGKGLGYELVRRSVEALAASGCEKASLTVTAANRKAVNLYQSMGFRAVRRFAAYVWEGF